MTQQIDLLENRMDPLTKRRINSLPPAAQKFYFDLPQGTYTTKLLADKLDMNPNSVGPLLSLLRQKGLIYSAPTKSNPKCYEHTRLDTADREPQGNLVEVTHRKRPHRRGNGSRPNGSGTPLTEMLDRMKSVREAIDDLNSAFLTQGSSLRSRAKHVRNEAERLVRAIDAALDA